MEDAQRSDLWEHFHNSLYSKSTTSVVIQWTKGHAKQHHIDKGITTHEKNKGNDKADENAVRSGHQVAPTSS